MTTLIEAADAAGQQMAYVLMGTENLDLTVNFYEDNDIITEEYASEVREHSDGYSLWLMNYALAATVTPYETNLN